MSTNPFVQLYEAPVESLIFSAYLLVLLAFLIATWYILLRNFLTLYNRWTSETWSKNTPLYPPASWAARAFVIPFILAIDLLLIAAFIHFLT